MKTDERLEEDAETPQRPGLMQRFGHAVTARELRLIDRTIGLFQRWRNHIEPHEEEDDRPGRRRAAPVPTAAPEEAAPARHGRLRGFLLVVALLLAAAIAGMTFSYSLLRKMIEADRLIIDDLRDQVAQMEKADARNVSIQAKDQQLLAEQRKTLREYDAKLQGYEDQLDELRRQIVALTPPPPRREAAVATAGRPGQRPAVRQKSGNCVATGSNAAADLARCVENFNRP